MSHSRHNGIGKLQLALSVAGLLMLSYAAPALRAQDPQVSPAQDAPQSQGAQQSQAPAPPPAYEQSPNDAQAPGDPQSQQMNQARPAPADQNTTMASDQNDPPSRAARISEIQGSVSLQPGGQGDWGSAVRNRPVTIGDKIWSDKDSRVELEAGQATIHLGSMTALSFLNLDGNVTQMRVAEGSINFRVREMREGDVYEVDTPNAVFTVKRAGAFRVDVSENGDGTRVTAIRGDGEVLAAGQTYTVHTGERAEFTGLDNSVQFVAHGAPPPDGLDRWANDRDLRQDNAVSSKYVNRDIPGIADLDDHGTWNEEPNVGPVWTPNDVGPDWAPYSDGAWNYVGPWGWSYVGYEPWGFAPYHYGRWGFYGSRWGWAPGPIYASPFYGPAFVGFLGGGFGAGFGIGFGLGFGVGWFPLGWGEPFHPWYHAGFGYVHNINIRNTAFRNGNVINNNHFNYAYAHNEHAVTAASRNSFSNGERINRSAPGATHLSGASLRNASVSSNGAGVSPNRSSYLGASHTGAGAARPSAAIQNRSVMARTTPSAAAGHQAVRTASAGTGSHGSNNSAANHDFNNSAANRSALSASNRPANSANSGSGRTWSAQGNTTDRGTAPRGAGENGAATNNLSRNNQNDRPPAARGTTANTPRNFNGNGANRGSVNSSVNRSASQASRNYSAPSRSYSAPSRSYSAPSRSYSAPSRANAAPSRGNSAPSHAPSHGGGGSAPHASGGGGSHGGGGGSHGGGTGHGGGRH
jgi:hypothetical protein